VILQCTPLGYALHFKDVPHGPDKVGTVALLQAEGAPVWRYDACNRLPSAR
jgi:hypothetical protein